MISESTTIPGLWLHSRPENPKDDVMAKANRRGPPRVGGESLSLFRRQTDRKRVEGASVFRRARLSTVADCLRRCRQGTLKPHAA